MRETLMLLATHVAAILIAELVLRTLPTRRPKTA
jgi:uncharacterized membrane protein (UPF0136 family)